MDFDDWLEQAWAEHADNPAAVAARVADEGPGRVAKAADLGALARLTHHVYGEHLQRWREGREMLQRLARHERGAAAADTLRLLDAGLALAGHLEDPRLGLSPSERNRVTAMAAASLVEHDPPRAAAMLHVAAGEVESKVLEDQDPACRALAVAGNNMASALEEKTSHSAAERELMLLAARTARTYWGRAGTWLETERAEYRLAKSWLKAGDPAQARHHARSCLDLVRQHEAPALEEFFAWEALGQAERAAGDGAGHAQALQQARAAFARLDEADRAWCLASLDALAA